MCSSAGGGAPSAPVSPSIRPATLHIQAADGALLAAYAPSGLLVVAVTAPGVNAGEVRLALLQAAEHAA